MTQLVAVGVGVVSLVAKQSFRPAAGSAWAACDGRDAVDQGEGLGDVDDVGRGGDDLERGATAIADQVVFAARLPPVDRRRTGVGAPFFARMWEPSTHARDQSSSPAAFSLASRTLCNRSKTPAFCHRSRRRQHVWPDPNPSSSGRSCQAMSLYRTKRMPCRQSRSDTGRGPGDRFGQGGSNGSIDAHNSSSTIHGRVPTPPERPNRHTGYAPPAHFNKIVLRALRTCRLLTLRPDLADEVAVQGVDPVLEGREQSFGVAVWCPARGGLDPCGADQGQADQP